MCHKKIKALFQNQSKKLIKLQDQHSFCTLRESSQNLGMGGQLNLFKNLWGKPEGKKRENIKFLGGMRFFHFHFLTLAIIITDTAFVGLGKKERAWSLLSS